MNLRIKEKSGITLIALVITIIVLLILAGVSIATLTGENGILTRAETTKKNTSESTAIEKVKLEVLGSYNKNGKVDITKLKNNLKDNLKVEAVGNKFPLKVTVDGYNIKIYENKVEIDRQTGGTEGTVADTWDNTEDTSWYNDTDTEFTIETAEQLAGFATLVDEGNTFENKTVKLGADIDLYCEKEPEDIQSDSYNIESILVSFNPIGSGAEDRAFKGTFDGCGHTIYNLYQKGLDLGIGLDLSYDGLRVIFVC